MSAFQLPEWSPREDRRMYIRAGILSGLVILLGLLLVIGYSVFHPAQVIGQEQPIPFSHRVHVTTKKISCVFCHDGVFREARATVPPLETCMLCHQRIAIHYAPIASLRQHYDSLQPVVWAKVTELPEFVYFNHALHTHRAIDCGSCHGDVGHMDRVVQVHELKMGFCISCHKEKHVTTDCFTCHR